MKKKINAVIILQLLVFFLLPQLITAQSAGSKYGKSSHWYLLFQYLGLTYHPDGGTTPEIYPLKLDKKAYFDLNVGMAANLDYNINKYCFLRFTTSLYKDFAFVTAGCFHAGPRIQYSWKKNRINLGIGPIFSYREDWYQFPEYTTDDFYGDRVYGKWQYRFFPYLVYAYGRFVFPSFSRILKCQSVRGQ